MAPWALLAKGTRTASDVCRRSPGLLGRLGALQARPRLGRPFVAHGGRQASAALALSCPFASESWERPAARASPMPSTSQPRPAEIWFGRRSVTCRWLATSSARPASSWACAASGCATASAGTWRQAERDRPRARRRRSQAAPVRRPVGRPRLPAARARPSRQSLYPESRHRPGCPGGGRPRARTLMASTRALTASTEAS